MELELPPLSTRDRCNATRRASSRRPPQTPRAVERPNRWVRLAVGSTAGCAAGARHGEGEEAAGRGGGGQWSGAEGERLGVGFDPREVLWGQDGVGAGRRGPV